MTQLLLGERSSWLVGLTLEPPSLASVVENLSQVGVMTRGDAALAALAAAERPDPARRRMRIRLQLR